MSRHWHSFHLYLYSHANYYMSCHLAPLIDALREEQIIQRFFFIRYWERGPHLRLRFMCTSEHAGHVERRLNESVNSFAVERQETHQENPNKMTDESVADLTITKEKYDRQELYFGDNMHTVYSELLNEQTSYLTLKVLQKVSERPTKLFLVLIFVIKSILNSLQDVNLVGEIIANGAQFALRNLGLVAKECDGLGQKGICSLTDTVLRNEKRVVRALDSDENVVRTVKLLKRLLNSKLDDRDFVSTHSLHLLCNKFGFGLRHEFLIYKVLSGVCNGTMAQL